MTTAKKASNKNVSRKAEDARAIAEEYQPFDWQEAKRRGMDEEEYNALLRQTVSKGRGAPSAQSLRKARSSMVLAMMDRGLVCRLKPDERIAVIEYGKSPEDRPKVRIYDDSVDAVYGLARSIDATEGTRKLYSPRAVRTEKGQWLSVVKASGGTSVGKYYYELPARDYAKGYVDAWKNAGIPPEYVDDCIDTDAKHSSAYMNGYTDGHKRIWEFKGEKPHEKSEEYMTPRYTVVKVEHCKARKKTAARKPTAKKRTAGRKSSSRNKAPAKKRR